MLVPNIIRSLLWPLLLLAVPTRATYWINQLDAYDSLPVCAEKPLSAIVRGMTSGCGDGNARTSYGCFCSTYSSKYNSIIATAVEKECDHSGTEVDSATKLFSDYCQLGKNSVATSTGTESETKTTSKEATTKNTQIVASSTVASSTGDTTKSDGQTTTPTASLAAITSSSTTATTTEVSPTSDTAADSSSSRSELSTGAKAAIGVCVPLGALILFALIFFYYRRVRGANMNHNKGSTQLVEMGDQNNHWPGVSLSETRVGPSAPDYFVAGSAPLDQHKNWSPQPERNMNHATQFGMSSPSSGFQSTNSSSNPFASAPPTNHVFQKAELDATNPVTPQHHELEQTTPNKYELP